MNRPSINIVVQFFSVVATLMMLALCVWAIRDAWFPTEIILQKHPDPNDHFYLVNRQLTFFAGALSVVAFLPALIISKGEGKPWVWNTILALLIISIFGNPILGIILLIFWVKEKNKQYYGKQ